MMGYFGTHRAARYAQVISLLLLSVAGPAAAEDRPAAPAAKPQTSDLKCKSTRVTGSLIQTKKVCRTEVEWQRLRDEARALVEGGQVCTGPACNGAPGT